jgi:hypothetical protein
VKPSKELVDLIPELANVVDNGYKEPTAEECVRFHKFMKNFEQMKMMMGEVGCTDTPVFADGHEGEVIRSNLTDACVDRMIELVEYDTILRQGWKGYEDMTDIELIEDWLEGLCENQPDDTWFSMPINVELEKAFKEKIGIMVEYIKQKR